MKHFGEKYITRGSDYVPPSNINECPSLLLKLMMKKVKMKFCLNVSETLEAGNIWRFQISN